MKRILITGANSYIGTSVEKYLAQWPEEYQVDTIDMRGDGWREKSFAGYDSVFHVAGIAHINTKKLDKRAQEDYWAVNAELPAEAAKKAKAESVKQFIFLSSMSVYGEHGSIKNPVSITKDTLPNPKDIYGHSKLVAEESILRLQNQGFSICILRPPMVYGIGCKGNYARLEKLALITPIFPKISNQRSMLNISKLCIFVRNLIDLQKEGVFVPQDEEFSCTTDIVRKIAFDYGRNIHFTRIFNPLLRACSGLISTLDKVFGDLIYMDEGVPIEKNPINPRT